MLRSRGCLAVWLSLALVVTAPYARAQSSGDEVIEDPELAGTRSSSASDSGGDEVISDPELGSAATSSSGFNSTSTSESSAPVSELHLTLHIRSNRDLKEDDPREEIWEGTGALILDAT